MAELFIELFSEEIPSKLQIDTRRKIKQIFEEKLQIKEIKFNSSKSFSRTKRKKFEGTKSWRASSSSRWFY